MINSWPTATKSQYVVYLKLLLQFMEETCATAAPTVYDGIEFLSMLFYQHYSFHQISMASSAISTLTLPISLAISESEIFYHHVRFPSKLEKYT